MTEGAIRTQRVLKQPPSRVYAAFERPEQLARWWGPHGFSCSFEIFEFKPGGRWKFVLHGPDGADYPNDNVFQQLEPGSRVVVRHPGAPHAFTLTVVLTPQGGGTLLSWEQAFDDPHEAARVRDFVVPANEQNLDRLQAVLEGA
jgi:uncharacterized protein YndB with AHSA1/START domain